MLVYRFSVRNSDGSHREDTGCMSLLNDYAALAFGNDIIRDMLPGNPDRHTGCAMEVAEGERVVLQHRISVAWSGLISGWLRRWR